MSNATTASFGFTPSRPSLPPRRQKLVENQVLAVAILVISELMFFTALISSYLVIKAATGNIWVPPADARLPVATTALNTLVLLGSGILLFRAGRAFEMDRRSEAARRLFGAAIGLGLIFVAVQGYEWVKLVAVGMTLTSGIFASTFYLIIGAHGLHVLGAALAMLAVFRHMHRGSLSLPGFQAMRIFWYFVVGIWPLLYGLVYF